MAQRCIVVVAEMKVKSPPSRIECEYEKEVDGRRRLHPAYLVCGTGKIIVFYYYSFIIIIVCLFVLCRFALIEYVLCGHIII